MSGTFAGVVFRKGGKGLNLLVQGFDFLFLRGDSGGVGGLVLGYLCLQVGEFGGCLLVLCSNLTENGGDYGSARGLVGVILGGRLGILDIRFEVCKEHIGEPVFLQFCAIRLGKVVLAVHLIEGGKSENTENRGDKIRKIHLFSCC